MAKQSLIWTALPNGHAGPGGPLRLSVLLSPRLDPGANAHVLSTFAPDWTDWPATLANATFHVQYEGETVEIAATDLDPSLSSRVDTAQGAADSVAWKALFPPDLPVQPFTYEDLADRPVVSYDTVALADAIQSLYIDMAVTVGAELPRATTLLENPNWARVIAAVQRVDAAFMDRETGLRKITEQFEAYARDRFKDLGAGPRKPNVDPLAAALARYQLFQTPMSAPKPRKATRTDDPRVSATWMEHEQTPMPSAEDLVKSIDFHRVVAAMNSYPILLRRLGLVVDLLIDRTALPHASDGLLSVNVKFSPGSLAIPSTPDASPVTHTAFTSRRFDAVSDPQPGAGAEQIKNGLLVLDDGTFDLLNGDIDGAVAKVMNFARTLRALIPTTARVDSVSRHEKTLGAPTLRTGGLTLVQSRRGEALESRLSANRSRNQAIEQTFAGQNAQPPELWAQDLVRGHRIDVWDSSTGEWRSLCRRHARFDLADGEVLVPSPSGEAPNGNATNGETWLEEEGFVRLAATTPADPDSGPKVISLHEALVAWNGWSLAAPPPGRAILPDDSVDSTSDETDAEVPDGIRLSSHFVAAPGSLPRLRFGRDYWMRARVVDLAGNSLPPQPDDFGPEKPHEHARPYLRYEPIAPPAIALVRPEGGATETPREGESMSRIAIRSFNDTPADNVIPTPEVARRAAVPPQVTVRDAEQHGMLDRLGKVDATTFQMLANERDFDATHPNAAVVEESIPMQGPLDPAPVEHTFAVYREGHTLTYLPDPLAEVAAVHVLDHPNVDPEQLIEVPLLVGAQWPDARPFLIQVHEHPSAEPWFDAPTRTLHVPLPKGVRARVRLSMRPSERALAALALWRWIEPADGAPISPTHQHMLDLARRGRHWMITPSHTVEVVHATQRPLISPTFETLVLRRDHRATSVRPEFTASCSIRTTDRVDLRARWHEPQDDSSLSKSADGPIDLDRGDLAYPVKISDPLRSAHGSIQPGLPRASAEHTIPKQDVIHVGRTERPPVAVKHHEFGDTRYRRIEYWLEATTRFREYMPPELLLDGDPMPGTEPTATEEHIRTVGPPVVRWVPSSAPPPAPKVLYVVPTFGWSRTESADGSRTSNRRGGGLRVYLDRPWCASGYGEMLAVVLPPASFNGDAQKDPAGQPYQQFITQWANDPIWISANTTTVAPKRSDFPRARTARDPSGAWLPPGAQIGEADQPPDPFPTTGLTPGGTPMFAPGAALEIAPHDVHYDAELGVWYCDIEVGGARGYFPFIRLALARYQPTSLPSAHLSPVVLADFMALANDRFVSVTPGATASTRRVSVFGTRPTSTAGHEETKNRIGIGGFSIARPATTTIFEAWVEQLNPSLGEDFGFSRVPTPSSGRPWLDAFRADRAIDIAGARTAGSTSRTAGSSARLVTAGAAASAATTASSAELSSAAIAAAASAAGFRLAPMWTGDVTVPTSTSPETRLRIVVAEYEEHLIDDDAIYNPFVPPLKTDRRLVFVEHFPLV